MEQKSDTQGRRGDNRPDNDVVRLGSLSGYWNGFCSHRGDPTWISQEEKAVK